MTDSKPLDELAIDVRMKAMQPHAFDSYTPQELALIGDGATTIRVYEVDGTYTDGLLMGVETRPEDLNKILSVHIARDGNLKDVLRIHPLVMFQIKPAEETPKPVHVRLTSTTGHDAVWTDTNDIAVPLNEWPKHHLQHLAEINAVVDVFGSIMKAGARGTVVAYKEAGQGEFCIGPELHIRISYTPSGTSADRICDVDNPNWYLRIVDEDVDFPPPDVFITGMAAEAPESPGDVTKRVKGYDYIKTRIYNRRTALNAAGRVFNVGLDEQMEFCEAIAEAIAGDIEPTDEQRQEAKHRFLTTIANDTMTVAGMFEDWLNRPMVIPDDLLD